MIRLNYGELPTREQFDKQWNEKLICTHYRITHGMPSRHGSIRPAEGVYSQDELWEELQNLWHMDCDESLGWTSDILYTLGFEWI